MKTIYETTFEPSQFGDFIKERKVTHITCKQCDKWKYDLVEMNTQITNLKKQIEEKDELLKEAVSFVEYAEKDKYKGTQFTSFLERIKELREGSEK